MKEIGMQRKNLKDDLKRLQYKRVLGSFSEGQGYADKRKRKTLNRYRKLQRKGPKKDTSHTTEGNEEVVGPCINSGDVPINSLSQGREKRATLDVDADIPATKRFHSSNKHRFSKAQREHQERLTKKQQKTQAQQEEKMRRETALDNYKKKKVQRNKLFSQKTKRGQPIMKHQIDFLLEKLKAEEDEAT